MKKYRAYFELSSKSRPDGRKTIYLRLSKGRELKKRLSTGVFVNKADFNSHAKYGYWIRTTDSMAEVKNSVLCKLHNKAENAFAVLENKNPNPTLESVIEMIQSGEEKNKSFFHFTENVIQQLRDSSRVNTYKKYNTSYNKMKEFVGKRELNFSDINLEFVINYETHLLKSGNQTNTVNKELKVLRALLYRGIKQGLYEQGANPFFRFSIKGQKTEKSKLTAEEITKIESLDLRECSGIWHTRNYFLFSFYTAGIRFADLCRLTWDDIDNNRLTYKMNKTSTTKSIKLFPQAQQILDYYTSSENKPTDFIFPLLDKTENYSDTFYLFQRISARNSLTNKYLKEIAKKAEIKTKIAFHMARHSFSEVARRKNVSIYDISHLLGHSNLTITQNYLKSIDLESGDAALAHMFNN